MNGETKPVFRILSTAVSGSSTSSPGPKRRGPSPAIGVPSGGGDSSSPPQQQPPVNDVNQWEPSDSLKRTALHFSCANNQPAIASLLLAVSRFLSLLLSSVILVFDSSDLNVVEAWA